MKRSLLVLAVAVLYFLHQDFWFWRSARPLVFGFLIHGLSIPGQSDTNLLNAIEAIPGALIGMGIVYWLGLRQERLHPAY